MPIMVPQEHVMKHAECHGTDAGFGGREPKATEGKGG